MSKATLATFHARRAFCRGCLYRVDNGCGMLARPCRIDTLWADPAEDWCPMNQPAAAVCKGEHRQKPDDAIPCKPPAAFASSAPLVNKPGL